VPTVSEFAKWIYKDNDSRRAWYVLGPSITSFISDCRTREMTIDNTVDALVSSEHFSRTFSFCRGGNPFGKPNDPSAKGVSNEALIGDLFTHIWRREPAWHKFVPSLSRDKFTRYVVEAAFDLADDPQVRESSSYQLAERCVARIEAAFLSEKDGLSQPISLPPLSESVLLQAVDTDDEPDTTGLIDEIKINDSLSIKAILLPRTMRDVEETLNVEPSTDEDEEDQLCWQLTLIAWPILAEPSDCVHAALRNLMWVSRLVYNRLHGESIIGVAESSRLGVPVCMHMGFDLPLFLSIARWVTTCMLASHESKGDEFKPFGVAMSLLIEAQSSTQPAVQCALAVAACEAIVVVGDGEVTHRFSIGLATLLLADASLRDASAKQFKELYRARCKVLHGEKIGDLLNKKNATTEDCADLACFVAASALAATFSYYDSQPHHSDEKDRLIKAIDQALFSATPVPGVPNHLNCGFPFRDPPKVVGR
jgi:hypothetical protein